MSICWRVVGEAQRPSALPKENEKQMIRCPIYQQKLSRMLITGFCDASQSLRCFTEGANWHTHHQRRLGTFVMPCRACHQGALADATATGLLSERYCQQGQ